MSWYSLIPLFCTALPLVRLVLDKLGQEWTFVLPTGAVKGGRGEQWHCAGVQVTTTTRDITQVKVQLPGALYCHVKSGHSPGAPQCQSSSLTPRTLWAPQGKAVTLTILPGNSCPFFSHPVQKSGLRGGGNSPWPEPSWGAALPCQVEHPAQSPALPRNPGNLAINIQHRSLHYSSYIILCGTCTVPMATSILHPAPLSRLFEASRISGVRAMAQSYFVLISLKNRHKKKRRKCSKVCFSNLSATWKARSGMGNTIPAAEGKGLLHNHLH